MSHPISHNGSVNEVGEFDPSVMYVLGVVVYKTKTFFHLQAFLMTLCFQGDFFFRILYITMAISHSDQGHVHSAGVRTARALCGPHTALKPQKSPHPHS